MLENWGKTDVFLEENWDLGGELHVFFDVSPFLQLTVRPWNLVLGNYFPLGTPTCRCYVSSREANWGKTDILHGCPQWLRSRTKWKPFFQGGWPVVKGSSHNAWSIGDFWVLVWEKGIVALKYILSLLWIKRIDSDQGCDCRKGNGQKVYELCVREIFRYSNDWRSYELQKFQPLVAKCETSDVWFWRWEETLMWKRRWWTKNYCRWWFQMWLGKTYECPDGLKPPFGECP